MSLFYLEQVIIEINNKSSYISYRNSMMTIYLRDSIVIIQIIKSLWKKKTNIKNKLNVF